MQWKITEHRGPAGLAAVEADWRRLCAEMPERALWHSHEAYSVYLEHLCPVPDRFRCLALSDGETVRAILPVEERFERGLGVPVRIWGMPWRDSWRPTDAIGPEDEARRALLPAAIEHLSRQPDRPGLFMVGQTEDRTALWDGLSGVSARWFAFDDGAEYVIPVAKPFDEFLATLSSRTRKAMARAAHQFDALPGASYVCAVSPDELAEEYEHLLDVEASGWKGQTGTAIKQHPELIAFYRGLIGRISQDGSCEIHSLHADGRCIASELNVYTHHECAGLKGGYDESYAYLSPGRLLTHKTVEWCCDRPDIDIASMVSDAEWLRQWRPDARGLRRAYVSLRPLSGFLFLEALRFRYGPARRAVRAFNKWNRRRKERAQSRRAQTAS